MSFAGSGIAVPAESRSLVSEESRAKFGLDGSPLRFTGATVLCHLCENGSHDAIFRSIVENCFDITDQVLLKNYVQLPKDSLHMTILDTKVYREKPGADPSQKTDMEEVRVADMIKFKQAFLAVQPELQKYIPVKMMADLSSSRHPDAGTPLSVPVKPVDEQEALKLRSIRETLCSAFSMSSPDSGYRFHVTGYYALQPLTKDQFRGVLENWSKSVMRISETVPTFEIDCIELCSFENMFHFHVEDSIAVKL